ncbi:MAG: KamA family radical SAM protein [Ignavibacteriae bacterium]|nr:KamA family radical SAM protein [Ignavibacteriota bacterium]MCB9219205.1 KamA family radical SAM protein [Ignavibacteriales bacterium]MCB9259787.1 KamA family radical SAM protein [Ignavibacteriales bacterium]
MIYSDDLVHRKFLDYGFWEKIPYFKNVSKEEFMDTKYQNQNSATKVDHLDELLEDLVSQEFLNDVRKGMEQTPMNLRLSPYILSLINWDDPYNDPLRIQFIPVASTSLEDHPKLSLDSLHEQADSPTSGLVHRYFDKALFLPLDVCPVYCRFCTRSYAIGSDTDLVTKYSFKPVPKKWNEAFAYIASRPEIEDIVVSGGDAYMLTPARLKQIGELLLDIPHVRRIRFATKGPAVMPMKILVDKEWTKAIIDIVELGRKMGKEVVIHTHFNSPNEITAITNEAMTYLFKQGVTVRNQSVLIRGVNDNVEDMTHLIRKLSYMNVQPYYVYQHDMVKGVEALRTKVADSVELELAVRGITAGFNTPLFVTDAPGGGGKRDLHSYDYYNQTTGISVYRSPSVDEDKVYLYFDPIDLLPEEGQKLWQDRNKHQEMIQEALIKSGNKELNPAI